MLFIRSQDIQTFGFQSSLLFFSLLAIALDDNLYDVTNFLNKNLGTFCLTLKLC